MRTFNLPSERIRLLTLQETATILSVSERTLRSYVKQQRIPAARLNRRLYFDERNISAFLRGARSIRDGHRVQAPEFDSDGF